MQIRLRIKIMFSYILIIILGTNLIECQQNLTVNEFEALSTLSVNSSDLLISNESITESIESKFQTSKDSINSSLIQNNESSDGTDSYLTIEDDEYSKNAESLATDSSYSSDFTDSYDSSPTLERTEPLSAIVYVWAAISLLYFVIIVIGFILSLKAFMNVINSAYIEDNQEPAMVPIRKIEGRTIDNQSQIGRASLPSLSPERSDIESVRSNISDRSLDDLSTLSNDVNRDNSLEGFPHFEKTKSESAESLEN